VSGCYQERKSKVSKATRQGQVTLATRSFGRGVDFVVDDEHMVTCGGLHVLLTFLPRDVQEEVQMMGRGARQGAAGSFSIVVRSQQLEDLAGNKATQDDISKWDCIHIKPHASGLRKGLQNELAWRLFPFLNALQTPAASCAA
jgi:hypothetical protein